MGKSKKFLALFVAFISIILLPINKVDAASGTISISSNKSQIVVGNSVTFTVNVNYSAGMVALQYNVDYDSSMLSLVSGSTSGAPTFNSSTSSQTYTYTFKAKKSGNAKFTFNAVGSTWGEKDEEITFASQSKSVNIITQQQLENSYSKNNNLSSLGVDGASLSPNFSSSVTSYTVNLPPNTESINVTGKKADSTASVSGLGNHAVEDGSNTIKIVVTAQNGSTKTYTITAVVEELSPIVVTVDDVEYNVVRKAKLLEAPNSDFQPTVTTIDEQEVPAFTNEIAKITLVGLKDSEGNIKLYIFDEATNTYKKYLQNTFASLTIYIVDKEVNGADGKKEISINDNPVTGYTIKDDDYYYFYGVNLENGQENLYRYDNDEKTIQKCYFDQEEEVIIPTNDDDIKIYQYIIIGLLGFILLTYIIIFINLIIKGKKSKKIRMDENTDDNMTDEEIVVESMYQDTDNEKDNLESEDNVNDASEDGEPDEEPEAKISDQEKDKLIKDTEEELNRINNATPSETNDIIDSINELFASSDEIKKKQKEVKKKAKTEAKNKKKKKTETD